MKDPTKAQQAILQYLWNARHSVFDEGREISGGDLVEHYAAIQAQKTAARYTDKGQEPPVWIGSPWTAGSPKAHAWRRSGGLQLRRMAEAGIMIDVGFRHGVPQYCISAEGSDWVEEHLNE